MAAAGQTSVPVHRGRWQRCPSDQPPVNVTDWVCQTSPRLLAFFSEKRLEAAEDEDRQPRGSLDISRVSNLPPPLETDSSVWRRRHRESQSDSGSRLLSFSLFLI